MLKKLGLVGAHIGRSRMAKLQSYLADISGESVQYELIDGTEIEGFNPETYFHTLAAQGYFGVNVTHPYKQIAFAQTAGALIEGHDRIGSYNTLRFDQGKIYGANTDYSGFKRGYQYRRPQQTPGKVLMCGAGGVGRAIAFALCELGADKLYLFDINQAQADSLANELCRYGYPVETIRAEALPECMQSCDGLVNCTALGMYNKPGSALPLDRIQTQAWAFDAVYTPLHTEFLTACQQQGMQCLTGFDLWIFQGLDAFEIFTGTDVPATEDLISTALGWLD